MIVLQKIKDFHYSVKERVINNKDGATMLQALGVSIAISIISLTVSSIVLNNVRVVNSDLLSSPATTEARASVDQSVYEIQKYADSIDLASYSAKQLTALFETNVLPTITSDYGVTAIDVSDLYNGSGTNTTNTGNYSLAYRIGSPSGNNMIYRDILISSTGSGSSSDLIGVPGDVINPDYIDADIYSANQLMLAGGVYLEGDIETNSYYQTERPLKYYNSYGIADSVFSQSDLVKYNFPTITADSKLRVNTKKIYNCNSAGVYIGDTKNYKDGCASYNHEKGNLKGEEYNNIVYQNIQAGVNNGFINQVNTGNLQYYLREYSGGFDAIPVSNISTNKQKYSYNFDGEQYALEVLAQAMNYSGSDLTFDNAFGMSLAMGFDEYSLNDLNSNGKIKNSFSYLGNSKDVTDGYIELGNGMDFSDVDDVAYLDGNGYPIKMTFSKKNQKYGGILVVNGDLTIDVHEFPMEMDLYIVVNGDITISNSVDGKYLTSSADLPLYIIASGNIEFSSFNRNAYTYNKNYFRQTAGSNFTFQLHAYLIAGGTITCETLTNDYISLVGGMYAFGQKPSTSYNDLSGIVLTSYRKTNAGGQTKDAKYDRFIFHSIDYEHERNYLPTFMYEYIGGSSGGSSDLYVTDFQVSNKNNFSG